MSANSQDAWDEICVNPHQSNMELGRMEGREAGLRAGFNDGFALGRTKGIEFGMELGFIRGFLNTVEIKVRTSQDDAARNERLLQRVDGLRRAIDEFPGPDIMFANTMNDDANDEKNDSESASKATDIVGSMQRIRAKFKVLTAQLKIPHFSLMQVMADAARMASEPSRSNLSGVINAINIDQDTIGKLQGTSSDW